MKEPGEYNVKNANRGEKVSSNGWSIVSNATERAISVPKVIIGNQLISLIHLLNAYYMQDNMLSPKNTQK